MSYDDWKTRAPAMPGPYDGDPYHYTCDDCGTRIKSINVRQHHEQTRHTIRAGRVVVLPKEDTVTENARAPDRGVEDMAATLRAAAAAIDDVAKQLNTKSDPCGACGHVHFEDWTQALAFKQIEGMGKKLRRWATSLEQHDTAAADDSNGNTDAPDGAHRRQS